MKASVSVDLDTLNDYSYTYGHSHQKFPDLIYTIALPRLIKLLNKHKIKATFFIVGRDLNIKEHYKVLKTIKDDGHEIANHTQNHLHNFEKLSFQKQKEEIEKCHNLAKKKLGVTMLGFRAPGYNLNKGTLKVLSKLRYQYDSSIFPTSLLPILKLIMIVKSKGNHKSTGGGKIQNIFSKTEAHFINRAKLVEIPITVTPILRLPFMGTFNLVMGKNFLKLSFSLIKQTKRSINYEIHPIEFLDFKKDKVPHSFQNHPGITIPLKIKIDLYESLFSMISNNYEIMTLKKFRGQIK